MEHLADRPPTLVVSDLTKRFGRRTLWSELSFTVPGGSMTAVRGPSGAGKTTLLNCIGRLEPFDGGTITFGRTSFGERRGGSSRRYFRDVVGFLFQSYGLVESWDVRQNLLVPLRAARRGRRDTRAAMAEVLARVGLDGVEKEKIYTLSGGEQQRVALARLILKAPSLVLADEPTSALDQDNGELVMSILAEQARGGALVLVSTHSDQVADWCDRTVTLEHHGLVRTGS